MDITTEELIENDCTFSLTDLNLDCLRLICRRLDMASQFALAKCSTGLFDFVVYDVWHLKDKENFDLAEEWSFMYRPIDFQAEFLEFLFQNFSHIDNISIPVFKKCLEMSTIKEFPKVVFMSLYNPNNMEDFNLELESFNRFPSLASLDLEKVVLTYLTVNLFDISRYFRRRRGHNFLKTKPINYQIRNFPRFRKSYRRAFSRPSCVFERVLRNWLAKVVACVYGTQQ